MKWHEVDHVVTMLTEQCREKAAQVQTAVRRLPAWEDAGVWYNPTRDYLWVQGPPKVAQWLKKEGVDVQFCLPGPPVSYPRSPFVKIAYSPTLRDITEAMNLTPGETFGVPNSPSPMASILTSGVLGAGLGYGLGYAGEHLMPNTWRRGRLRRSLALAGAGLGSLPGLAWGASNAILGRDLNDPFLLDSPPTGVKESSIDYGEFGSTGAKLQRPIPVNEFNQVVWADPRVAGRLDLSTQVAATSLLGGAAKRTGSPFITPVDMGLMTAGMGSGYMSGLLVGKMLGGLMGMPEETQDRLKNVGMWAGLVKNIVPIAFGG